MLILDRLLGLIPQEFANSITKLPIKQFVASLIEYSVRGVITWNEFITDFPLDEQEQSELQPLINNLSTGIVDRDKLMDVLMKGEYGFYNKDKVRQLLQW